jgi:UDP-N-acetylmuramoyl-tripeptide--D-alanyl-D-alanine ligase
MILKNNIDKLITIGHDARYIAEGAYEQGMDSEGIVSFDTVEEALAELLNYVEEKSVVLVKASRAMELERVTEFLKNNF